MRIIAIVLLCAQLAVAQVVIHQVLYDPISTESGAEAIELINWGPAVDVSGWVIATESSKTDIVLPQATMLSAQSSFLIADEGWSEHKDNSSWRKADYEEKMTLGNSDSGIALLANGEIVDALGWGDKESINEGLVMGEPAVQAPAGSALIRVQNTKDNNNDFIAAVPDFFEGMPIAMLADVSIQAPVFEIPKEVRLSPKGKVTIRNNGEDVIIVKLRFSDLVLGKNTIPSSAIESPSEIIVQPKSESEILVELNVPKNTVPGTYRSTARVIVEK